MKKVLSYLFVICLLMLFGCSTPKIHVIRSLVVPSEYDITKAKNIYREANPTCEVCGAKRNIVNGNRNPVHHRLPVHLYHELAATQTNLVTLCERHHFWIGHCDNYQAYNRRLNETIKAVREAYNNNAEKVK